MGRIIEKYDLYIQSVSNYKININLNVTDWNPANVSEYTNVSWDYNGTSLNPGETIQVTLTFSVPYSQAFVRYLIDEEVQNFSFDIHIVAS